MLSNSHNDLLFFVILLVGFHVLMCLGELSFFLPGHKANKFFEGNKIIVPQNSSGNNPDEPFCKYLQSRD